MIQLIGHHSWLAAKNPTVIDDQAVEHGTQRALKDLNTLVLKPLVAELSGLDLAFVKAMAEDPGPSKVSDIAARIDRSADTVAQYRRRLIARHQPREMGSGTPLAGAAAGLGARRRCSYSDESLRCQGPGS